jgi:acetate kinase
MSAGILSINGGSSSIKFSLFKKEGQPVPLFSGNIKRIGMSDAVLSVKHLPQEKEQRTPVDAKNIREAATHLIDWFSRNPKEYITAIGHRILNGINHSHATLITDSLLAELDKNIFIGPDHLPGEIMLIKSFPRLTAKLLYT